jgi:hypothetical protein
MSNRPLIRVTCTLPSDLVAAADRLAKAEGRSRSWIVAEALHAFQRARRDVPLAAGDRVREAVPPPYAVREAFEAASRAQLEADARLTPEQRVRVADELASEAARIRPQPRVRQALFFDSWEDYLAWKRTDFLL